jgi:hypothetical protein
MTHWTVRRVPHRGGSIRGFDSCQGAPPPGRLNRPAATATARRCPGTGRTAIPSR